jgi:glycosyltransferase involved in cell wall biosynthesis
MTSSPKAASPKLLYLVTEAGYFFSHRYPLAKAAQQQGYEVMVATVLGRYQQRLIAEGFTVHPLRHMTRTGLNPFKQFLSLFEIYTLYRKEKPDVVHHVAMKPVLYGSIAARLARVKKVVNALTGLGYLFISSDFKARFLKFWVWKGFHLLFQKRGWVLILQNKDDFDLFSEIVSSENLALIRGSGVDIHHFFPLKKEASNKRVRVALVARMLWDKGIGEAIESAKLLKEKGLDFELVLAGGIDAQNPSGISQSVIEKWVHEGLCTWLGNVEDIAGLYQNSDVALLPSYREGLPKCLLEAAACGLPIVTTDVPGCREIVVPNKTGFLVPAKTVEPLANTLEKLVCDKELRHRLGAEGRKMVEKHFSLETVAQKTLKLYK